MKSKNINTDTICALSTPAGVSAIAVIRISGKKSIKICEKIFKPADKKIKLSKVRPNSIHLGSICTKDKMIDEVLVSIFKAPMSYTGEDLAEISCHGSAYIQQKIIELLINNGARPAKPGEFTLRAFLNNKFDLSQAEAVADLIASNSKASHELAINQMRGVFSDNIKKLRQKLVNFTSLIELELDFSQEDVEFADRKKFTALLSDIKKETIRLIDSFSLGNVLKHGIPVTIIGRPNVGKSTLLNAILNEDKAIVSDIPGTTRDIIEDTISINGISFRFIDTAGLKESGSDRIENIGIEKTYEKINQASIILYVFDISENTFEEVIKELNDLKKHLNDKSKKFIIIANKTDLIYETPKKFNTLVALETIFISAKRKKNINLISDSLMNYVASQKPNESNVIISNSRHYESLTKVRESIENVEQGIKKGISSDLLTTDIRKAIHYLGEITGEITTSEILDNIFSNFCIGK